MLRHLETADQSQLGGTCKPGNIQELYSSATPAMHCLECIRNSELYNCQASELVGLGGLNPFNINSGESRGHREFYTHYIECFLYWWSPFQLVFQSKLLTNLEYLKTKLYISSWKLKPHPWTLSLFLGKGKNVVTTVVSTAFAIPRPGSSDALSNCVEIFSETTQISYTLLWKFMSLWQKCWEAKQHFFISSQFFFQ